MSKAFLTVLACLASGSCLAQELDGDGIRKVLAGRTVVMSAMGFSMPLTYRADGSVSGDGSRTILTRYFAPSETGRWWVESDRLCQQFPTWYSGKAWCFSLRAVGAETLQWVRDDGFAGKAEILAEG